MEYRRLGSSGLKVPVLSFGTGTFGGGTEFFKAWGSSDVAEATRLVDICLEAGVNMIGCQMTVDLFGYSHGDFIPEVKEYVGAATFLPMAKDADVSLFI